uniref:Secreted protein n=1 Tax=Aegilops tauschii subsp. strangulata TaxID=200361 RepID=A0A453BEU9_AEGTS
MLGRQWGCGCCHTWAQQIIIMWSLVPTDCFLFQNGNVCYKYYKLFIHVELKLDSGFQYHTRTHFIRRFNSILQLVLFSKSSMD